MAQQRSSTAQQAKKSKMQSTSATDILEKGDVRALSHNDMLGLAASCSCGAIACYLWGRSNKGRADYFDSITRVIDFKALDEMLKEKATNLLVVVSGRVASAAPINCKDNGPLDAVFEGKAEMGFETKLEDGGLISTSFNFLFQKKETPWYLEDSMGRVKVVGAQDAQGFLDTLEEGNNMSIGEILGRIINPEEGSQVICRAGLGIGTSLTIVGEADRDKAGNLVIQKPSEIFSGECSFDKMVGKLKANSEFYFFYSKIFGVIALAAAVYHGVGVIRRWKRNNTR